MMLIRPLGILLIFNNFYSLANSHLGITNCNLQMLLLGSNELPANWAKYHLKMSSYKIVACKLKIRERESMGGLHTHTHKP